MTSYIGESGTFSLMKNLNLEKVFRVIVLEAPISRAEISRLTGLNKVTVSNCVKSLMGANLITEEGIVFADNGRPPTMLMLSDSFGVVIGVELSPLATMIVVTDFRGQILEKPLTEPRSLSPEECAAKLSELVEYCNEKYSNTTAGVISVGIALPVNYNQMSLADKHSALPKWEGVDANEFFKGKLGGVPVEILSTSAAGAIAEVHFGDADINSCLAYIHGAMKLKVDIYHGEETYSNRGSFSGSLGNIICRDENGKIMHLDDVASVKYLKNVLYGEDASLYQAALDISRRAKFKDPELYEAMDHMLGYLAEAIYDVIQIFNPDTICLGGLLGQIIGKGYNDMLVEKVLEYTGDEYPAADRVICSKLGLYGVAFGCISWIRDNMIAYCFEEE